LLLNVALLGMEEAAGVRYQNTGPRAGATVRKSPVVVRYADDLVAMCTSAEQAEEVKARLSTWLAPRGLVFNEEKTRVVHLDEGFDFLGHADLRVMPTSSETSLSEAAIGLMRSA